MVQALKGLKIREIENADIDTILNIRVSTHENHFSMEDLAEIGITPNSVAEWIEGSIRGWICEISGKAVGFAMADGESAEMLVIAILPDYEKKGIGKGLMGQLQNWLWSLGHRRLWLWSNPNQGVRAHGFYRNLGWRPTGEIKGNNEMLELIRSGVESG